jgi:hypothetical protein
MKTQPEPERRNRLVNINLLYEECGEVYDSLSPTEKHGAHKLMCFLYEKATGESPPDDAFLSDFDRKFNARLE